MRVRISASRKWSDLGGQVTDFSRRCARRFETGQASFSDPAMFGTAVGEQLRIG